jgi:hypothetical protein
MRRDVTILNSVPRAYGNPSMVFVGNSSDAPPRWRSWISMTGLGIPEARFNWEVAANRNIVP